MTADNRSRLSALTGCVTPVPTPFSKGGIDRDALRRFCAWQASQGISGLVVTGTTGEGAALSAGERRDVIGVALAAVDSRVPVIAGVPPMTPAEAAEAAALAQQAGVDGLLVVAQPSLGLDKLMEYFGAVRGACSLPVWVHDRPASTTEGLPVDVIARLADQTAADGLVDSAGDPARLPRLRRAVGEDFRIFGGNDATVVECLSAGGNGCVSPTANIDPMMCLWLHEAWGRGEASEARAIARTLAPLTHAISLDAYAVTVKFALSLMTWMSADVRRPLAPASAATRAALAEALTRLGHLAESMPEARPYL